MSRNVEVLFEVRSMLIMKDTLNKMGIKYRELNDGSISINKSYHNIKIDSKAGKISFDEMHLSEVNTIKQII